MTIFVHIALAIIFFYLLNWIGRQTVSLGYLQLSIFARQDEAPAFNFILRTASPTVFIIVVAALLYAAGKDELVKDIWYVVPYYFIFRAVFNIALERANLVNWNVFMLQAVVAIWLSWFIYGKLILTESYIVPDAETLANNLWLIIILFFYSVLNRIQTSSEATRRRKRRYIVAKHSVLKKQYGDLVAQNATDENVARLAFAVMIYENFGRPRIIRTFESLIPGIALTRGIMQVRSRDKISDKQSVEIALTKLNRDFIASLASTRTEYHSLIKSHDESNAEDMIIDQATRKTIVLYNKDEDYVHEVQMLVAILKELEEESNI